MTKESYSKLWTFFAVIVLYTSLNMYLGIQRSSMALPYPNFDKIVYELIPLYSILLFVVMYPVLMIITKFYYRKHSAKEYWTKRIPFAFNLNVENYKSIDVKYFQSASIFLFFILPLILQIHVLNAILNSKVYLKYKDLSGKTVYKLWANDPKSHLFKWPDLSSEYIIGKAIPEGWATYFPTIQSWLFLSLIIFYYYRTVILLLLIFKGKNVNGGTMNTKIL